MPDLYRGEPLVLAAKLERACRHARDQGPDRRPALGRHPAAGQRRRRPRPVEAVGAAQDRRRRGRAHAAADHAGRGRQGDPGARARASPGDAADQPRRRRQDAEPPRRRAAHPRRDAAQPAGRLGFRQGVRRRAFVCAGAGGTACRRRAGAACAACSYAAVAVSSVPKPAAPKFVSAPRGGATCPRPRPTRSCGCGSALPCAALA